MDMLSFSKERVPELRDGDVRHTVTEVVELMQARADEVHARLIWEPPTHFPSVRFDPDALHRAILNVVTNALDAVESREQGEVRVSLQIAPQSQLVELAIDENGEGIAPENLERIFSVFESKKGARGNRLGLAGQSQDFARAWRRRLGRQPTWPRHPLHAPLAWHHRRRRSPHHDLAKL